MLFANIFLYAWRMFKILKSNKKKYKKTTYKTPGRAHACRVARDILVCAYLLFVVNQLQPDMARRQRKYVNNSV